MAALTQTPADVTLAGAGATVLGNAIAGEAITQGMPVYKSAADSKHYKCDSNASEAAAQCVGIALTPAAAG